MIARKKFSALALVFCAACSAPATEKSVTPSITPEPTSPDAHFVSYDVKTDAELDTMTSAAKQKTPDWSIVLDPFGYLSHATCDTCTATGLRSTVLFAEDQPKIEAFLAAQRDLLASDAPFITEQNVNSGASLFFSQKTPYGVAGFFRVSRTAGRLTVSGHAWPRLPSLTGMRSDPELEAALRKLDADPALTVVHAVRTYAKTTAGPVELHAVLCLDNAADNMLPHGPSAPPVPLRPCVDAFTGEDLRPIAAGWIVSDTNGRVTSRHLTKLTN